MTKGVRMPKEEWGVKRVCPTTGKRFYDLNRKPIVSPYTGEVVSFDANNKSHVAVVEKESKSRKDLVEDDEVLLDDDDENEVDLEDDLLDEEDDDNVSLDDLTDVAGEDEES